MKIEYTSKKEKKEKKEKKIKKEKKESVKKEKNPCWITEKQNVNTLKDGYSYPENKIIRFDNTFDNEEELTSMLRILPQQVYSGGNTNTPTVNAKPDRKTRRGKRGGRKNNEKKENQSFLDFIANEEPSVIMDTPEKPQQTDNSILKETSAIEEVEGNDSICISSSKRPLPHIGDIVQFPHVVLNYETLSPEMKTISGVVKKYLFIEVHHA